MIGLESLQRRVGGARNCLRRKILRNFALTTAARFAVMHEIIANLRRDGYFVALFRKRFGDQLLAQTVSVSVRRVEQRDAEIERLVHERNRFALREISPPPGRN